MATISRFEAFVSWMWPLRARLRNGKLFRDSVEQPNRPFELIGLQADPVGYMANGFGPTARSVSDLVSGLGEEHGQRGAKRDGPLLFNRRPSKPKLSTEDRLVYAVGDIHGRQDLLDALVQEIRRDIAFGPRHADPRPTVVFLGDYIDRGPRSREVVETLIGLRRDLRIEARMLKGNHEQAMLRFLEDAEFGPQWAIHGGAQTMASYGIQAPTSRTPGDLWVAAQAAFTAAVPEAHKAFLSSLELKTVIGDYLFVHAGVRPGVALDAQTEQDMLWIRNDFLKHRRPFQKLIVHGHTPVERPVLNDRRIGVDTGAYATGMLTALRLDGALRQFISVRLPK